MKTAILIMAALVAPALAAMADETVTFDFSNTMSLNPTVNEPGLKQGVDLDGRSFTSGGVEVKFTASDYGNTHVRLYHSYDAGVDLRLYDGDKMTVTCLSKQIIGIRFTMSLSGAATGTNDINFIPSTGTFDWAAETWTPDDEDVCTDVELTSAEQSRISSMTVTLSDLSDIELTDVSAVTDSAACYFTLRGERLTALPAAPGVYVRVAGAAKSKILVR